MIFTERISHTIDCNNMCQGATKFSMPTNLAIDDDLLNTAKRLGRHRTKRETVNAALLEYIQRRKRLEALKVLGKIDLDPDFDYKRARAKR